MPAGYEVASAARVEAATLLRRLGHAFSGHHADDAVFERLVAAVAPIVAELEAGPPRDRMQTASATHSSFHAVTRDGDPLEHFPDCVVSGRANPMGIAIEVKRRGDGVEAWVTFGSAFEGAPTRTHGGIVAAVFDDVFGYLLPVIKRAAFTGTLQVRYRAATPLHVPLRYRAWVAGEEGRKLFFAAECHHGDQLIAEATATFVTIPVELVRPDFRE